jgi:alkanesulfonate monooxygenase SsuD/methylene tetrahydromethanopterin reductase-like flavin-dependent oxidoreductase (luciferase family)
MKYGVYLPNFGEFGDACILAQWAKEAEDAGWDGFFIWDHIALGSWAPPTAMVDPFVALTAIALNTKRIRLGALVTPLPRRRPWKFARETVSLDRLSGGRLVVGVGIGTEEQAEWESLDEETDFKTRGAMLDEGLDVLAGLWSGEAFHYQGVYYHVKSAQFLPKPQQSPRIPLWVGGYWPHKAPLRRAARWDGVFALFNEEGEPELMALQEMVAYVLQQRGHNTSPFDIVYAGHPTPGDNPKRAAEIVRMYAEHGVTWWLEHINPVAFGMGADGKWPLEAMRHRIQQGPPRLV